jgi:acetate kinase
MSAVLVVNAGSSSVKFRLFGTHGGALADPLAEGLVESIGSVDARFTYTPRLEGKAPRVETLDVADHDVALRSILRAILAREDGVLGSRADVGVVGHRIVHGADRFQAPTLVTREVRAQIEKCSRFAPLHNPVNLAGLSACEKLFPAARQVAVFDTAFHATLPREAFLYPLPQVLYERHAIRRYGFHGTSHQYVSRRYLAMAREAHRPASRVIVCHLGNGSSICAVRDGRSVDTSMGFTPLEGLMMGTRSGDIDPGVLLSLLGLEGMTAEELDRILNKYSGFRGVTEDTSDVRTVLEKAALGYERHKLALAMFCYRVKKYVGSYAAALGGLDALVFTGGIGENAAAIRAGVCEGLEFLGVELDAVRNSSPARGERIVSREGAGTAVAVVPTNEEWMIAAEALEVVAAHEAHAARAVAGKVLDPEARLALVKAWQACGGQEDEVIEAFARESGVRLTSVALRAELSSVGILG